MVSWLEGPELGSYFVWIHLRKERFPQLRKNNLMPRAMGPFQIIDKYGDNAFKIDLPEGIGVSPTFNIGDLAPYLGDNELRAIPFQQGGNEPPWDGDEDEAQEAAQHESCSSPEIAAASDTDSTEQPPLLQQRICDQPTLLDTHRTAQDESRVKEGIIGILAHGPSYMGPRTLLKVRNKPQRTELQVTHSADQSNKTALEPDVSTDQQTWGTMARSPPLTYGSTRGVSGISTLHTCILNPEEGWKTPTKL